MPLRRPLLLSLLLGAICLTVARSGPLESPVHQQFQVLLDGPLSMLRNVHKVDPLMQAAPRARSRPAGDRLVAGGRPAMGGCADDDPGAGRGGAPGQRAAVVVGRPPQAGMVGGARGLVPGGRLPRRAGGHGLDPGPAGLGVRPAGLGLDHRRADPGPREHAVGDPQPGPADPGGTIRNLDAIQERISDGQGSPALAMLLARAGVEYVLVRRDLDIFASGAPDPARVDLAISRSPGLVLAASFGRSGFGEQPMIDIYRVGGHGRGAEAVDLDDVRTLAGGPEDVLTALESGALDPESPVVIAGEDNWPDAAPDLVADGYRKRERAFGRLEDALGEVMARDEPYRVVRSAHDYPGVPVSSGSTPATTASTRSPPRPRAGTPTRWGRCVPRSGRTPPWTGCPRPTGSPHR